MDELLEDEEEREGVAAGVKKEFSVVQELSKAQPKTRGCPHVVIGGPCEAAFVQQRAADYVWLSLGPRISFASAPSIVTEHLQGVIRIDATRAGQALTLRSSGCCTVQLLVGGERESFEQVAVGSTTLKETIETTPVGVQIN